MIMGYGLYGDGAEWFIMESVFASGEGGMAQLSLGISILFGVERREILLLGWNT